MQQMRCAAPGARNVRTRRETGDTYDDDMHDEDRTEPELEIHRAVPGEYRCPAGRSYPYPQMSRRLPSLDHYDGAGSDDALDRDGY